MTIGSEVPATPVTSFARIIAMSAEANDAKCVGDTLAQLSIRFSRSMTRLWLETGEPAFAAAIQESARMKLADAVARIPVGSELAAF